MPHTRSQNSEAFPLPEAVGQLCQRLADTSSPLDRSGVWPEQQIKWCAATGVFRWFLPEEFGGWGWNEQQILAGYLALSQSCLTTTFVLTQWHAACRRILTSDNRDLKSRLLPSLASGELFATVGISHLTTSRQHLLQPVLRAEELPGRGYVLNGYSPWVTSAAMADLIVVGASLADGRQILCALPSQRAGVTTHPGQALVALTSSCTDAIELQGVEVTSDEILAGPVESVLSTGAGGGAGGLQTSTLAVGLSLAAVDFIRAQVAQRSELVPIYEKLARDANELKRALVDLTDAVESISPGELRQRANSLALRSTQAALTSAKGAGFVATHVAGRMAREALFFLVWSCPQPVAAANLCELAQLT